MDATIKVNKLLIEVKEAPIGRVVKADIPIVLRCSVTHYSNWRAKEFRKDPELKKRYFKDEVQSRSIPKDLFMEIVTRFAQHTDIDFVFK